MRGTSRNETPKPGTFNSHVGPKDKNKSDDRVASVNTYDTIRTERGRALAALEKMKELERKRKKHMVSVRIDERTVVNVAKGREKETIEQIKKRKI